VSEKVQIDGKGKGVLSGGCRKFQKNSRGGEAAFCRDATVPGNGIPYHICKTLGGSQKMDKVEFVQWIRESGEEGGRPRHVTKKYCK